MPDEDDTYYATRRLEDRTYFSGSFPGPNGPQRFAYKVWDANGKPRFAWVSGGKKVKPDLNPKEVTVRHEEVIKPIGEKARFQIRAILIESTRKIQEVVLQKFTTKTGKPHESTHISLTPQQAERLLEFFRAIRSYPLPGGGKRERLDGVQLNRLLRDEEDRLDFLREHSELADLLQRTVREGMGVEGIVRLALEKDIAGSVVEKLVEENVALEDVMLSTRRKRVLQMFSGLLDDPNFLEEKRQEWDCAGIEATWQRFFESNSWILGYGLQYQFGENLSGKKLEQFVAGRSVATGGGKKVDALLKTLGVINSLCFVEIKKHDTDLLEAKEYGGRSDVFSPSRQLAGAVAQIQVTTQKAMMQIKERLQPVNADGFETGEFLYAIAPRSLVVCGSLSEFRRDGMDHRAKIRAFELYRRSLHTPEIITFDELYERARFIVVPTEENGEE